MGSTNAVTRRRLVKSMGTIGLGASLAGCGGNGNGDGDGDGDGNGNGDGNGTDGGDADEGEEVGSLEVNSWAWLVHGELMENEIGPEFANRTNHTWSGRVIPADQVESTLTQAFQTQSGLPDSTMLRAQLKRSFAQNGGLLQLDDLISENEDRYFDLAKTKMRVDDGTALQLEGEGSYYSGEQDLGPMLWFYNKDLFAEAGLPTDPADVEEEIQTYQQLIDAGEDLESETGAKMLTFPRSGILSGLPTALQHQLSETGRFYNEDLEFEYDRESNRQAFEILVQLDEINAAAEFFSGTYWQQFRDGDVASGIAPGWFIKFPKRNLGDMDASFGVAKIPMVDDIVQGAGTPRAANKGGATVGIPAALDSDRVDVAREFTDFWLHSDFKVRTYVEAGNTPGVYNEGVDLDSVLDDFYDGQTIMEKAIEVADECNDQYNVPSPTVRDLEEEAARLIVQEGADIDETVSSTHEEMVSDLS